MSHIGAVTLLVLLGFVTPLRDSNQSPTSQPSLRLSLTPERESYALGEPAYLIARLRNEGTSPVRLLARMHPKDGLLTVALRDPAGRGVGYMPLSARDTDEPPSDLAPGAEQAVVFPIFYGASGWTLQQSGQYVASGRFLVQDGSGKRDVIVSDSVSFTVRPDFAEGAKFLIQSGDASSEAGTFLVRGGGDQLQRGIAHLEAYAARFPDSPVVDHFRVALGRSLSRPFKDYRSGKVREPDCRRALVLLAQARDSALGPYVRAQKSIAQVRCARAVGDVPRAEQYLSGVRALIKARPELRSLQEQVDRIGESTPR